MEPECCAELVDLVDARCAMSEADPLLRIHSLSIAFGGIHAVEALSFDVPTEAVVALIGPNGAGKTTVLNAVSGFVPANGRVEFEGTNLLRLPAHRRAWLGIGRTFQNLQLFGGLTLLENVLTGEHTRIPGNLVWDMLRFPVVEQEKLARERAIVVLGLLGLADYADRPVDSLPFGVQKLAGVARALANSPRLLLLDEPAAGLNFHESAVLGNLILSLRAELGVTILLVEHNMRLVMRISDHIVVLDEGQKLTEGPPDTVSQDPAVIAAYLGSVPDETTVSEVQSELSHRS
jgi:branched-chain amino acid transport system ATP-binding protein